jgi:hypothetical protein
MAVNISGHHTVVSVPKLEAMLPHRQHTWKQLELAFGRIFNAKHATRRERTQAAHQMKSLLQCSEISNCFG